MQCEATGRRDRVQIEPLWFSIRRIESIQIDLPIELFEILNGFESIIPISSSQRFSAGLLSQPLTIQYFYQRTSEAVYLIYFPVC